MAEATGSDDTRLYGTFNQDAAGSSSEVMNGMTRPKSGWDRLRAMRGRLLPILRKAEDSIDNAKPDLRAAEEGQGIADACSPKENCDGSTQRKDQELTIKETLSNTKDVMNKSMDFLGRLATLVVMIVTTIDTIITTISHFVEEIYWSGALHLAFLVFINIPALVALAVVLGKSLANSIEKKVRPRNRKKNSKDKGSATGNGSNHDGNGSDGKSKGKNMVTPANENFTFTVNETQQSETASYRRRLPGITPKDTSKDKDYVLRYNQGNPTL